jgi:hypothetical protein
MGMRRHTDLFPLGIGTAAIALYAILQNIYQNALQAWVLDWLKRHGHQDQLATVLSRLLPMVPDITLIILVIGGLYWYIKREFEKTSEAFSITPNVYAESHAIRSSSGRSAQNLSQNIFYLVVGNAIPKGETIKRAQMRAFNYGAPTVARIKDSNDGIADLRHGELLFFEVGRLIHPEVFGVHNGAIEIDDSDLEAQEHNVPLGYFRFEICPHVGQGFGLGHNPSTPNHVWPLICVISADDVVSKQVEISIDMTSKTPVRINSVS